MSDLLEKHLVEFSDEMKQSTITLTRLHIRSFQIYQLCIHGELEALIEQWTLSEQVTEDDENSLILFMDTFKIKVTHLVRVARYSLFHQ